VESDILWDIGIKFSPISDIHIVFDNHHSLVLQRSLTVQRGMSLNLKDEIFFFFNVG
jgi:hypothetical protein